MDRLRVNRSVNVTCMFAWDQWQLFALENVSEVAEDLNFQLEVFVNTGYSKNDVRKYMHGIMASYSDYGACDTEPMSFLEEVLNEIFRGF